jgi:hypothetical protein
MEPLRLIKTGQFNLADPRVFTNSWNDVLSPHAGLRRVAPGLIGIPACGHALRHAIAGRIEIPRVGTRLTRYKK